MATLQKFKLLATQCSMAGTPSRSPTASPVYQLRRRKTLRMFLTRSSGGRRLQRQEESMDRQRTVSDPPEKTKGLLSHKLKDLFVSSPPFDGNGKVTEKIREKGEGMLTRPSRRVRSLRPLSGAFRYRLLKRAWRPVLVTIPE